MGSPPSEDGRNPDEGPVHTVRIGHPLAVAKNPVTRGEWRKYLTDSGRTGSHDCVATLGSKPGNWLRPGFGQQDDHPAVCIAWQEAEDYAAWMSQRTGRHYRLLSEAEYEYLERAGSQHPYPWGGMRGAGRSQCALTNAADVALLDVGVGYDYAHCDDGFAYTSPVARFPANAFGLHDIDGNVQSWTEDCYQESYRGAPQDGSAWGPAPCERHVARGASWYDDPRGLRSARRDWNIISHDTIGVRLVRTLGSCGQSAPC